MKQRFGLSRFDQQSRVGVFRLLRFALLAFLLSERMEAPQSGEPPDWGELAAQATAWLLVPLLYLELRIQRERLKRLSKELGLELRASLALGSV